jgi:hypothetical protein
MRNLCLKIVLLLLFFPGFGFPQGAVQPQGTQGPTTHILAIGRFTRTLSVEERRSIMPREASETLRLILAGKIDQEWLQQDAKGPVFS